MIKRKVVLASLILLLAACGKQAADPAPKGSEAGTPPPPMPVTVKRMQLQRVPLAIELIGQAEGSREVEIRARVSGILEKRVYVEGAQVNAGQTLFVIDRTTHEITARQARATLAQERARQEQTQREVDRLKSLAQNKAISQREYDDMSSALKQSNAAVEVAQAKLAEAELNLSYTEVKAPISSGITGRALRSEGSLVTANNDLLTTLTQVNPIWLRFSLAEADYTRIRGNARSAQINILNPDGSVAARNGRINFTGSSVDPKLGTVPMRSEFANPDLKWLPGQFVKVQVLTGEQQAFLVPQSAVVQTELSRMVWVADADGKANMRPVQTANWLGSDWIVTGGLKPGDAVIVDNLMKLRPGTAVAPQDSRPAAPNAAPVGDAAPARGAAPAAPRAAKAAG